MALEHVASWLRLIRGRRNVRRYQFRALQRLVRHAGERVPYYREAFAAAQVTACDLRSLDDLTRFSISAKSDYQRTALTSRFATGLSTENCRLHETSGSTGERMLIARTPGEELKLFGRRLRSQILSGLRPGHRRLILGAHPRQLKAHKLGIFRTSGIELSRSPNEILEEAERLRPNILKGPPGALELLLEESPQRLAATSLEMIPSGAEQLPRGLRDRLEACYSCPVIEVLNGNQPALPGEEGDVVVTALHSYAMPFIRYQIGDRVSLPISQPACRIPFGSIARIQGRSVDYLRFPGDIAVSPYEIMDQLDALAEVRRYQVVQGESYAIEVQIEAPTADASSIERRVRDILKPVLPARVSIEARRVELIDAPPEAKRRFAQSRIARAHA